MVVRLHEISHFLFKIYLLTRLSYQLRVGLLNNWSSLYDSQFQLFYRLVMNAQMLLHPLHPLLENPHSFVDSIAEL